jgi:hypothetical protein
MLAEIRAPAIPHNTGARTRLTMHASNDGVHGEGAPAGALVFGASGRGSSSHAPSKFWSRNSDTAPSKCSQLRSFARFPHAVLLNRHFMYGRAFIRYLQMPCFARPIATAPSPVLPMAPEPDLANALTTPIYLNSCSASLQTCTTLIRSNEAANFQYGWHPVAGGMASCARAPHTAPAISGLYHLHCALSPEKYIPCLLLCSPRVCRASFGLGASCQPVR